MAKDKDKYKRCIISLTKKGEGFGVCDGIKKDIFISKDKLKGALHGDTVLIQIENEKYWEGRVTKIEERAKEEFSGTIQKDKVGYFVIPKDQKAQQIKILIKDLGEYIFKEGDVVAVKITDWKNGNEMPEGKIIKRLGVAGDNNTEMEAIAFEHGFQQGHGGALIKEAEEINHNGIGENDIKGRRDFRSVVTFTIDPDDAKDFDDALSIRPTDEGKFEIGIHIADVSHYVKPGSVLDKEALKRSTSVYLVDRVIPMLPEILSNNLCSLLPNKDRLTFSAVFIIDTSGNIHDEWFGKTIIHSDRRFTYDDVQKIIETGSPEDGEKFNKEILMLQKIAKKLRKERFANGSVSLDSVEIKFKLDEKGKPIGVYKKVQNDANKLVEEFMLLANKKVAGKIFKRGDDAGKIFVYRNHELPDSDKLEGLKEVLVNFRYNIPQKVGIDSKVLNKIIEEFEGKMERSLVMWIILRSMSKADYSTENLGHFGLAFDSYTHFTSPIRRYPDVMVHRLLDAHLQNQKIKQDKKDYEKICKHASEMERRAMNAERESIKYKQVEFVLDKIGETFDGIITGVTDWGMFIEAQEIFCEGMVSLRDIKDDHYSIDKKGFTLVGQKTNKKYRIGDAVRVELISANLKNRTIDFRLI